MENDDLCLDDDGRRLKLGRFLRECRERLSPQAAGLPITKRRRTPGLRREEVAVLASISATYYTKIEQGRVDVSERVLSAIADVLKCSNTERDYAFALATGRTTRKPERPEEAITPALERFLELQEPYPVQIMGRRWDILAWNQATCATLGDIDRIPPQARNLLMMMFTAPEMKQVIVDWEANARCILAEFRADYGKYHDDPAFGKLIAYLMDNSAEFNRWWPELTDVGCPAEAEKIINHPTAGILNLIETSLTVTDHPGLRVVLFLPQDEATEQKLQILYETHMAQREIRPSADGTKGRDLAESPQEETAAGQLQKLRNP